MLFDIYYRSCRQWQPELPRRHQSSAKCDVVEAGLDTESRQDAKVDVSKPPVSCQSSVAPLGRSPALGEGSCWCQRQNCSYTGANSGRLLLDSTLRRTNAETICRNYMRSAALGRTVLVPGCYRNLINPFAPRRLLLVPTATPSTTAEEEEAAASATTLLARRDEERTCTCC